MVKNRIYKTLWNIRCPKVHNGKKCEGKLHKTNVFDGTLEFYCHTCKCYTTASFEYANIIISDTKEPPVIKRE